MRGYTTSLYSHTYLEHKEVCRVYISHSFDINVNTKTKLDGTLLLSRRLYFYQSNELLHDYITRHIYSTMIVTSSIPNKTHCMRFTYINSTQKIIKSIFIISSSCFIFQILEFRQRVSITVPNIPKIACLYTSQSTKPP